MSKRGRRTRQSPIRELQRRRAAERARGSLILAVCIAIALAIVVAAAWEPAANAVRTAMYDGEDLASVGKSSSDAGCQTTYTIPVAGSTSAVTTSSGSYLTAPPAFGSYSSSASDSASVYSTRSDSPELPILLTYLRAGYTILWYDSTVHGAQLLQIQAIARKFNDTSDGRDRFLAVPWLAAYASQVAKTYKKLASFPTGTHIAFTHWSNGGVGATGTDAVGAYQYCGSVSGAALKQFMQTFPYTDSPDPGTDPGVSTS
ncbi:MAG: DUF3105 domain-containing protein [Nocardioides sp.]